MNNFFRAIIAGYGAKKLGGGCFSTVLVFVLLWVLLGQCGAALPPPDADAAPPAAVEAPAPPAEPAVALVPAG
ncbi:hypothetical protein RQM47_13760 [Rubrivirga sp. S365]|uniref:Uncharacterized protein n=1 Tax=Rubrivirga litoralis TaxID=3075598 RepID=A0ABU3BMX9_9BACT|nr:MULTISPECIES: hypothetical protein [unclassified Rubrivirga]MDT0630575.1 hypothetical protein [Rubrivirga sp. F394]MDT7857713.1 hypothetical protein [Rubrivirga sp. S365]